jgi:hypothetical protein
MHPALGFIAILLPVVLYASLLPSLRVLIDPEAASPFKLGTKTMKKIFCQRTTAMSTRVDEVADSFGRWRCAFTLKSMLSCH